MALLLGWCSGEWRAVVGDVDDGEGVLHLEALLVLPDVLADEGAREGGLMCGCE
nr:hypothetical protein [Streptomyces cyaneochromogenes]